MKHTRVVSNIQNLACDRNLSFQTRAKEIARRLHDISKADVLEHLENAGIIPECFEHDSTEEKLYAKYCDALLARSLALLGMTTEVIAERSDSADVIGKLEGYSLVGDAKAFRLSRTAKNQKDFKVEALNEWRNGAEYAILCAPLYQYPKSSSQIYEQATRYNVTLISYTHLAYLIRNKPKDKASLRRLWELDNASTPSKDAKAYWNIVNNTVCEITGTKMKQWEAAVKALKATLDALADKQAQFWEQEKQRIGNLPHNEVVKKLIKALKIDSKITTIRRWKKFTFL